MQEMYAHPFCLQDLDHSLSHSAVQEIAPDVWLLEGFLGISMFIASPSSNVFILRDRDLVILLDTGFYSYYRPRILKILKDYARQGAKELVLMVTQGHYDHVLNNDIILEAGFDNVRFLLPEPEVPVIEPIGHLLDNLSQCENYFNPYPVWVEQLKILEDYARKIDAYGDPFYQDVWSSIIALSPASGPQEVRSALKLTGEKVMLRGKRTMVEKAEILTLESRIKKKFGDVEFMGWQIGRFFVIHDASHSPGHCSLYDPLNKLMISGDVTIEINPVFFDSSLVRCIGTTGKFRRMAELGFIETATDSHRSKTWSSELLALSNITPLDPIECTDVARGTGECITFFRMFEEYYTGLRDEILAIHAGIGEATFEQIMNAFLKSGSKAATFKKSLPFPSCVNLLIAKVLSENGCIRRVRDKKVLFSPAAG